MLTVTAPVSLGDLTDACLCIFVPETLRESYQQPCIRSRRSTEPGVLCCPYGPATSQTDSRRIAGDSDHHQPSGLARFLVSSIARPMTASAAPPQVTGCAQGSCADRLIPNPTSTLSRPTA